MFFHVSNAQFPVESLLLELFAHAMMILCVDMLQQSTAIDSEVVGAEENGSRSTATSEHTRMLEARVATLRKQVVDTANLWRKKLHRMQDKYENISSVLKAEYEAKVDKMKKEFGTNRTLLVESMQQSNSKKLQMLFEKFERQKRHFDTTSSKLRAQLETVSDNFKLTSNTWELEKEDLKRAIGDLTDKLERERQNSRIVASEAQLHMEAQIEFLKNAITLRCTDIKRMRLAVERAMMRTEDMRARLLSQTARFLHLQKENSM
jgi:hypothetical protein